MPQLRLPLRPAALPDLRLRRVAPPRSIRSLHSELRDVASEAHLLAGNRVLANILTVHERLLRLFPVMRGVPGEGSPEYLE